MDGQQKNRFAGFVLGPLIVFISLGAIWKNENRFDYHEAATKTRAIESPRELVSGELFSYTGSMNPDLVLDGDYVDSFSGYLMVRRSAEIYAWDRETDSDNHETWTRRWMSRVESNSRNADISQQLSSRVFTPERYQVGDLTVLGQDIEFVNKSAGISPDVLRVTDPRLREQGGYLYLSKGRSDNLGDERISYQGIPVPAVATYFGKAESGRGVADKSRARTGMINELIQDSGVLHHLVAGDRDIALTTMAAHLAQLKWIVRAVASLGVIMGFSILFSSLIGFLYSIPVIGGIAQSGVFVLSLVFGLPLILVTMLGGYLVANPVVLAVVVVLLSVGLFALGRRKQQVQTAVRRDLENHYGAQVKTLNITELEFIELAKLMFSDGSVDLKEEEFLWRWSRKQGWNKAHFTEMLARAKSMNDGPPSRIATEDHLKNLIRLALADGNLSGSELRTIEAAAIRLGYDSGRVMRLTQQVQQMALTGSMPAV